MTPLGKTIFAALSLAVLVGGAIALRHKPAPAASPAQAAQVAQVPQMTPEPPKTMTADAGATDEEPPPEDGSGS